MEEDICQELIPLWEKLHNAEPMAELFRGPVDIVKYGCWTYYEHIKHPINLSTVKEKLDKKHYKDVWRFVADIQLMFANSFYYNRKGTTVHDFTNKLQKLWNQELAPIMQRLNYCCSLTHKFGPQPLFCYGTTPERYCQIAIGAKYYCYQDKFSFCIPCFTKIDSAHVTIVDRSSETSRTELPNEPVKKSLFGEHCNNVEQFETFVQCINCLKRLHQICELYPADDKEIELCIQHKELSQEQIDQCQVPEEFRNITEETKLQLIAQHTALMKQKEPNTKSSQKSSAKNSNNNNSAATKITPASTPTSKATPSQASISSRSFGPTSNSGLDFLTQGQSSLGNETSSYKLEPSKIISKYGKFMCNNCYTRLSGARDLRHRRWSARRLPHTRMSRFMENQINDFIRVKAPTAGAVTVRVLAAYRDKYQVKSNMKDYVNANRSDSERHPNAHDYPEQFEFTNRAIFAWQEIDGVDVCVFGMHVQEYGDDCPEPNRLCVYLSYLDSVHYFRPREYRTCVYHEMILSYFRYVKRLGFRKVFIWVCPSRKGDDYIFYRHPSDQKMPTLKRLTDWYYRLLDAGISSKIVSRYQNIHEYADSEEWSSITSLPYLSGDYWPSEVERLLNIMIETKKEQEVQQQQLVQQEPREEFQQHNSHLSEIYDIFPMVPYPPTSSLPANHLHYPHESQQEHHQQPCQKHIPNGQSGDANWTNGYTFPRATPVSIGQGLSNSQPSSSSPWASHLWNPTVSRSSSSSLNYIPFKREQPVDTLPQPVNIDTPDSMVEEIFLSSDEEADQPLDLSRQNAALASPLPDDAVASTSPQEIDRRSSFSSNEPTAPTGRGKRKRRNVSSSSGYTRKRSSKGYMLKETTGGLSPAAGNNLCNGRRDSLSKGKSGKHRGQTQRDNSNTSDAAIPLDPEVELMKNLEKSLKKQKDGFIVAHLCDCDCSPHYEKIRRDQEPMVECNLMHGREPLLQLARQRNYEFSTLRRAKFSSLAMVKHLRDTFQLEPICNRCFSHDTIKHYKCDTCIDFFLCSACYDNTHEHKLELMPPTQDPDIDDLNMHCSHYLAQTPTPAKSSPLSSRSLLATTVKVNNRVVEKLVNKARIKYDVDLDKMKDESEEILHHYLMCHTKDSCTICRFVVLSCSFLSVIGTRRPITASNSANSNNNSATTNRYRN